MEEERPSTDRGDGTDCGGVSERVGRSRCPSSGAHTHWYTLVPVMYTPECGRVAVIIVRIVSPLRHATGEENSHVIATTMRQPSCYTESRSTFVFPQLSFFNLACAGPHSLQHLSVHQTVLVFCLVYNDRSRNVRLFVQVGEYGCIQPRFIRRCIALGQAQGMTTLSPPALLSNPRAAHI